MASFRVLEEHFEIPKYSIARVKSIDDYRNVMTMSDRGWLLRIEYSPW